MHYFTDMASKHNTNKPKYIGTQVFNLVHNVLTHASAVKYAISHINILTVNKVDIITN